MFVCPASGNMHLTHPTCARITQMQYMLRCSARHHDELVLHSISHILYNAPYFCNHGRNDSRSSSCRSSVSHASRRRTHAGFFRSVSALIPRKERRGWPVRSKIYYIAGCCTSPPTGYVTSSFETAWPAYTTRTQSTHTRPGIAA